MFEREKFVEVSTIWICSSFLVIISNIIDRDLDNAVSMLKYDIACQSLIWKDILFSFIMMIFFFEQFQDKWCQLSEENCEVFEFRMIDYIHNLYWCQFIKCCIWYLFIFMNDNHKKFCHQGSRWLILEIDDSLSVRCVLLVFFCWLQSISTIHFTDWHCNRLHRKFAEHYS